MHKHATCCIERLYNGKLKVFKLTMSLKYDLDEVIDFFLKVTKTLNIAVLKKFQV